MWPSLIVYRKQRLEVSKSITYTLLNLLGWEFVNTDKTALVTVSSQNSDWCRQGALHN